jgi:ribosomal protein L9
MIGLQKARHDLKKFQDILHSITEGAERAEETGEGGNGDEEQERRRETRLAEMRRRQAKFTKRFISILNLLEPDTIVEYFGSDDHEEIWRELERRDISVDARNICKRQAISRIRLSQAGYVDVIPTEM